MAKQKTEPKVILEREYIVPLRKGWLKVPKYKRGNKAIKTLKEFIARHMKVYDRDLKKVKLNIDLNRELWFRGIKKPPAKIKVSAKRFDDGIVRVDLVDIPAVIKFSILREKKKKSVKESVPKKQEQAENIKEKPEEKESEETKEKEKTSRDANLKLAKQQARAERHTSKEKPSEKQWIEKNRKTISRPGQ
jgi:large subunit ribosomal protein L31e